MSGLELGHERLHHLTVTASILGSFSHFSEQAATITSENGRVLLRLQSMSENASTEQSILREWVMMCLCGFDLSGG